MTDKKSQLKGFSATNLEIARWQLKVSNVIHKVDSKLIAEETQVSKAETGKRTSNYWSGEIEFEGVFLNDLYTGNLLL